MTSDAKSAETGKRILFMDDEPHKPIIKELQIALEENGHRVDFMSSMAEAIEAYYQKFYDLFILDIDMSHHPDDEAGDGVSVLKRFISLHNQTKVIIFSGAGTVDHWFEAANSHCFAYVAKDEKQSIEKVLQFVDMAERDPIPPALQIMEEPPSEVLLYGSVYQQEVMTVLNEKQKAEMPDITIRTVSSLTEAKRQLESERDPFFAVVLLQEQFDLWPETKGPLEVITQMGPTPQIIIGCRGGQEDEHKASVLFMANLQPFRMVNLDNPLWTEHLAEAIRKARVWYGQEEIFTADPAALHRLKITLPEEALAQWDDEPWDGETDADDESLEYGD